MNNCGVDLGCAGSTAASCRHRDAAWAAAREATLHVPVPQHDCCLAQDLPTCHLMQRMGSLFCLLRKETTSEPSSWEVHLLPLACVTELHALSA